MAKLCVQLLMNEPMSFIAPRQNKKLFDAIFHHHDNTVTFPNFCFGYQENRIYGTKKIARLVVKIDQEAGMTRAGNCLKRGSHWRTLMFRLSTDEKPTEQYC